MELFDREFDENKNLLPYDGEVYYFGKCFTLQESQHYFQELLKNIDWKQDEAIIYGKHIVTNRKVAWHGDQAFPYTYSNTTKTALPWTKELIELKNILEKKTGETFNSCLLNLYHDGSEGMAWHSDAEKELIPNGAIGSISLGAERRFLFKHKRSNEKISTFLENGSVLVMKGTTQTHWLHQIPVSKKIAEVRINLTFRTIRT